MDSDLSRIDLPSPPHLGVNQGLIAATERRAFGDGDQLLGLNWQKRQGDRTDTLNLQAWRENFADTDGTKITRMLDPVQESGKVGGDR
jgi:hypothetical protein